MRNTRLWPLLLLAATVVARTDQAAGQTDQTDEFVKGEIQRQNIPGLSLVVLKDGDIVKAAGYGLADIRRPIPATPETVYRIASVSKQFIATGIMLLVQEGRLGLDDPLSRFLDRTPPAWSGITIRHLLTHTSGIVREAPGFDPLKTQSDAEVIRTTYPLALGFAPGEKWEYGNVNYYALAEVIRVVAGRPWSEFLRERVFEPLGMSATHPTNTPLSLPNRAAGYLDNNKLLDAPDWPALRPSGAFLSTVLDLAKWDAALYTDRILTQSTRRQMWTRVTLNDGTTARYGFGWELDSLRGRWLVHHSGGMPGWRAEFARFVDDGLTVIVLMNLDDVDVDVIMLGVARLYLPTTGGPGDNAADHLDWQTANDVYAAKSDCRGRSDASNLGAACQVLRDPPPANTCKARRCRHAHAHYVMRIC